MIWQDTLNRWETVSPPLKALLPPFCIQTKICMFCVCLGCTEQAVYFQIYKLKKAGDASQGGSSPKKRGRKGQYELKGTTKKVKQEADVKPVAAAVKNEEGDDETRND